MEMRPLAIVEAAPEHDCHAHGLIGVPSTYEQSDFLFSRPYTVYPLHDPMQQILYTTQCYYLRVQKL